MFKDEFLIPFQDYLHKTLRLVFFVSIVSFLFFSLLESSKKGLVSNVFNVNFFLAGGIISLVLIILDYSNQDSSAQTVGALNNRERLWVVLIAISVGVWVIRRLEKYGPGALPLAIATAIFVFFFLRASLEKPKTVQKGNTETLGDRR